MEALTRRQPQASPCRRRSVPTLYRPWRPRRRGTSIDRTRTNRRPGLARGTACPVHPPYPPHPPRSRYGRRFRGLSELAQAPIWGLVRSAQVENPDRPIFLVDSDDTDASRRALAAIITANSADQQVAIRQGRVFLPRLAPLDTRDTRLPPAEAEAWSLDIPTNGAPDNLALVPYSKALSPLAATEVRIAVRAAGLNVPDVRATLEAAGVVVEVGSGVASLAPGDRVMGIVPTAFAPFAITDHRLLSPIPASLSFTVAAAVPAAFLTAYYCLNDIARLKPGERVLIHAAESQVGMAAIQLARHCGAEVFATASPSKWDTLRALGFDDAHIASSRTLDFEPHFLRSTNGVGVDVVLNFLVREFVDASFRLLPRGGRFIELGKTDRRDPNGVAALHPNLVYRAFDLVVEDPGRTQALLAELARLFDQGILRPPTVTAYDVRHAPRALRALAQAPDIEKVVLTIPRPLDPRGTVLIAGGTGTLGAFLARHLARAHGVKHLILASRQGQQARGALRIKEELETSGVRVTLAACDVTDRSQVEALLACVPKDHPLTAIVHAAGSLDDGLFTALTPERLHPVLRSKLDAAVHLHELSQSLDLAAFVLYSSAAAVIGSPGQANYAAANAFLDALALHRSACGLPTLSLDWGFWQEKSALTASLSEADFRRITRSGFRPSPKRAGLLSSTQLLLDPRAPLRGSFRQRRPCQTARRVARRLRALVRPRIARRTAVNTPTASSLHKRLLARPHAQRLVEVLDLVRSQAALVLATKPSAVEPTRPLKDLGLDSLMAVEIRNRLAAATGLRLRATILFDHPTADALARFLIAELFGSERKPAVQHAPSPQNETDDPIAIVGIACRFPGDVRSPEDLWRILQEGQDLIGDFPSNRGWNVDGIFDPDPDDDRQDLRSRRRLHRMMPIGSTPHSSTSVRVRRSLSIRSSDFCSKPRGRPSSAQVSTRPRFRGRRPASLSASCTTTTRSSELRMRSKVTSGSAALQASPRDASRTHSAFTDQR